MWWILEVRILVSGVGCDKIYLVVACSNPRGVLVLVSLVTDWVF